MRLLPALLSALTLIACAPVTGTDEMAQAPVPLPDTSLPVFGDGYPQAGDACRRFGESAETVEFLDHTSDLVGCPEAWPGREAYAASVNAEEVLRQDGWVLYSIPRGI
jgi:hypothetical protein